MRQPAFFTEWVMGRLAICCLAVAAFLFIAMNAAVADPKRVVVLHSYSQNSKPWSEYSKAFRQELERQSHWPLIIQDFSVITAFADEENTESQFFQYLSALFSRNTPDLIVAFGAPAAAFVQRYRNRLLPATPMLLTAVDQRRVQHTTLTVNDTVVAVRLNISKLFENILAVLPNTKTVAVVIGNSPNERFWVEEMQRELEPLKDRVKILFYNDLSFQDILKQAASLPQNSAIFWVQPQVDATGAVHEGEQALKMLSAVANAPIFSHDDAYFGGEIVGGPMTSVSVGAAKASEVAVRILGGEKPADITTPALEYGPAKFDWRQLQRWNISENRLPPASEIYFREPPIWEKYRWQVGLACAALLVQALLITGLLYEARRRRYAEVQVRRRMSELAHINRYSMAGELTASIAHELGQPLGAILTNAESAELMLVASAPDMAEIRQIIAEIRRDDERASEIISRLRSLLKKAPFECKDLDLNELVSETVDLLSGLAVARGVDLSSSMSPMPLPISGDRIQFQQVLINLVVNAMEAMSNNASGVRRITIWTTRTENSAEVSVSDVGPGIPLDKCREVFEPFFSTKPNGMGMGLSIARSIVEAHHGRISAENQVEGGAIFWVRLPLA
jgi:signal transduction histidine kinase/ABC-type uncharacterized transport system substrate-binding protein